MRVRMLLLPALVAAVCVVSSPADAQVKKDTVPGVINYAELQSTVACGGTITPAAVAELKQRGFKSIFDLQLPDEKDHQLEAQSAAAKDAGINFIHVPFTPAHPDTASVDKFLTEIQKPGNEPAFIHCSGGNRAAGFWMIKRVLVDHWDVDKAMTEAEALGLSSKGMKDFAVDYIHSHQK